MQKELQPILDRLPKKINTDSDYKIAGDALKILNTKLKAVEEKRKAETQPLLLEKKNIDDKYKVYTKPVQEIIKNVKEMIAVYHEEQRVLQLEAEKKALAEADSEEVIVDDKLANIKHGEFSTTSVLSIKKYRLKDKSLEGVIDIKQNKLKEWLVDNKIPEWLEEYEDTQVRIR